MNGGLARFLRREGRGAGAEAKHVETGDIGEDRPPAVYRRFLYLDKEEILNALSAVQGGAVDEAVDEIVRSGERNVGLSIAVGGQGLKVGGKSANELKRGLRRRQTVHAAIAALLHVLRHEIRTLPQPVRTPLDENTLVEFRTVLCHCQSRFVLKAYEDERRKREAQNVLQRLLDRRSRSEKEERERAAGFGQSFVALASPATARDGPKFVLCLKSEHLVVPPSEFSRRVTVVGQIIGKPEADEHVVLEGDQRGTTALLAPVEEEEPLRRPDEAQRLSVADLAWSGTPAEDATADALLLRPLCIYK